MKKLLLALVLVSVGEVMAEDRLLPIEKGGHTLPKGSYQGSSSCIYDGSAVLYCRCMGKNGQLYYNEFRVTPGEDRDIMNIDGVLTFSRPNGSYRGNCSSCDYTNGTLHCLCKKDDGSSKDTTLVVDLGEVRDIKNVNGSLTLGALPLGEYIKNCYDCTFNKINVLECKCHDSKGEIKNSGLWLNSGERRNIINKNGELQFDTSVHM